MGGTKSIMSGAFQASMSAHIPDKAQLANSNSSFRRHSKSGSRKCSLGLSFIALGFKDKIV